MEKPTSIFPSGPVDQPEASKDPIRMLMEIAESDKLSDEYKHALIQYAQTRFRNRRMMAYWALVAILVSLGLLFMAAFIDGLSNPGPGEGILHAIENSQTLFIWVEGFLTTIVAAYFGAAAFRPSS